MQPALQIEELHVRLHGRDRTVCAVNGVSLALLAGRVLALVGESGSGKSMTVRAIMRLLPPGAEVHGHVWLEDRDLLRLSGRELRRIRGVRVALAFQNASASLNPTLTIGGHLRETLRAHAGRGPRSWQELALDALQGAGLPRSAAVLNAYPFELSGGQQQRVALALATALHPAVLLISHDLAVAAHWADDLAVMYGGTVVETGEAATVLAAPRHPYTAALIACQPRLRGGEITAVPGGAPSLFAPSAHCPYADRCPRADAVCAAEPAPPLRGAGRRSACYHPLEPVA